MTITYFLAPGWDFTAESIPLGSIIADPMQPHISLFKPSPADLVTSPMTNSEESDFTGSIDVAGNGSTGLFCTFLSLHGMGEEAAFRYDRKSVLSYSCAGLQTHALTPGNDLLRAAAAPDGEGALSQFFRAADSHFSVFIVTGIKTIKGAGVTTASRKGKGWRVSLGIGAGTEHQTHDSHHDAGAEEPASVVFAFGLMGVRVSQADGVMTVALEDSQKDLQSRLDRDFGPGALTVVEGFDEETGLPCLIVGSNPRCVDLLSASSTRIDALRSQAGELESI